MQNLDKLHQSFPKILTGNENVMDGRTDGWTDGQPENSIPLYTSYAGGINIFGELGKFGQVFSEEGSTDPPPTLPIGGPHKCAGG